MAKKTTKKIITEDRILQRVFLEILISRCDDLTIKKAKQLARDLSVKARNTLYYIEKEGLELSDYEANCEGFWINHVLNSGKDFNKKYNGKVYAKEKNNNQKN